MIKPLNGQRVTLAAPLTITSTTVRTVGRFYDDFNDTDILGGQMATISPFSDNYEFVYIDISSSPTLIEDRSAEGKPNIYEYPLTVRGVPRGSTAVPPTEVAGMKKEHSYGSPLILPVTAEYFEQLIALFEANNAMRAIQLYCFDYETDVTVGNNRAFFVVPSKYNGSTAVRLRAVTLQTGTVSGSTDIDVLKNGVSAATASIGFGDSSATETISFEVATDDLIRIDVTAQTGTAAKGLIVLIEFNA